MQEPLPNKHQLRTQETQARLLEAAEMVFIRDGYENAQLATIAAAAGRTKGAVYAHYKSKEDLFFALFEHRMQQHIGQFKQMLEKCTNRKQRQLSFRQFFLDKIEDQSWFNLIHEYKLFALRHPESIDRLRLAFQQARPTECDPIFEQLFGKLSEAQKRAVNIGLAAIGPILSSLIIESHFDPDNLNRTAVRALLDNLISTLFPMFA